MEVVGTQSTREREVVDAEHRRQFIERMERKLAQKEALRRQRRMQFRGRLSRLRTWQ